MSANERIKTLQIANNFLMSANLPLITKKQKIQLEIFLQMPYD